jgi:hypothetical protein
VQPPPRCACSVAVSGNRCATGGRR